MQIKLDIRTF